MILKKTKIICTIGPSSESFETLTELAKAGMDVARLNFSHGNHEEKARVIKNIRTVSQDIGKPIAIVADLQGPKLRLGELEGRLELQKGQGVSLSSEPQDADLPMQFDLSEMVKVGQRIFLNDGLVELEITEIHGKRIVTVAKNNGWVSSHKGVNIPDTHFTKNVFTKKDIEDLEFALSQNVEYVALSFIQSPEDVTHVRNIISDKKKPTKICVKIEKNEAIEFLEEIVRESDVIMIARGDLAIETSAAQVPVLQQKIIRLGRQFQKPVIVATQMLESMIENPRPTRAEASDVAYAVMYQVDAVMLSAESAAGKYPVQAVQVMHDIIHSVENNPEYKYYIKVNWEHIGTENLQSNAITSSAASLSYKLKAPLLAVATSKGATARNIASFRPNATIVAVTHDETTRNQLNLVWGLYPFTVTPTDTSDSYWEAIAQKIRDEKIGKKDEKTVMVGGTAVGVSGATDTIKVVTL
ncbi:MAG TPA: pyruvate kinase [Candidatus Levybacteria bacterium]|nr:pyruvate kinase [Candidatus Levybacteria bacterium]